MAEAKPKEEKAQRPTSNAQVAQPASTEQSEEKKPVTYINADGITVDPHGKPV